ncbi:hypothetical protein SAMN05660462_00523 [Proteiniborus ethanoligenes]|uniref:DUF3592 domain-containing protein n=1 Tax=Proteiniborus ethanoligenes TaxID=415015 RepID=A0A1H3LFT4_9FIRM|nr:hypothetical protein [Proteiniborus ethanoligenes]SDY63253.1 hypothetical protein SAMN05660462_00523 [Proteiniborus ethanoligenes]
MKKKKIRSIGIRILITVIGIMFILWGLSTLALGAFGVKETALITNVRREGGERSEATPGRYTYVVSYTFKLEDGRSIDGFTKKISDGVFIKHPNTVTAVKYFSFFPYINALEEETKPGLSQIIYLVIGGFLIVAMNKKTD